MKPRSDDLPIDCCDEQNCARVRQRPLSNFPSAVGPLRSRGIRPVISRELPSLVEEDFDGVR
jgi:hypothetical protein